MTWSKEMPQTLPVTRETVLGAGIARQPTVAAP